MRYKNLILIGTSHIAKESVNTVSKTIADEKPDVVCIELDKNRIEGLLSKAKQGIGNPFQIGFGGWLFALIVHYLQKKLGNIVNIDPGAEMLAAIESAKKVDAKIALIDQDIRITLKKIKFKPRDIWNFIVDLIKGILFPKQEIKEMGLSTFDLSTVPEDKLIEKLIIRVKKRYPYIYQVLIHERDIVMARNIYRIMHENKLVVAVVGAGHKQGITTILNKLFEQKAGIAGQ